MKKTILAAGFAGFALFASPVWADVSETRDLDSFTEVELDGMMEVNIRVGEEQSFKITANKERYLDTVKTRVKGDRLYVDMEHDGGFFSFFRDVEVTIDITVPALDYAKLDGMGDMDIYNVDSENFELILDGMGSVRIDGRCTKARLVVDGMGDLNAKNFECENVRVILDGMGNATVFASVAVDVLLDGFGDVTVYGDPEDRRVTEDGMGDVDFK